MNIKKRYIKDSALTLIIFATAFGISILLQNVLDISEHVTTLFAFAVFLISLFTDGFWYGIVSTVASVIAINYAFTYPYFNMDFSVPESVFSAIVMLIISLLTSMFTTRLKTWQMLKAEGEKERMRANLLRAVSHDLRTPLTTIYGSSTTLLENNDTLTNEQRVKIITGIKEDSDWLVRMVENLLSVTKIDSGQVKIIKTPTVLEELIDSVMLKFKKRYPTQKVKIELPDDVIIIPMDAILIEQVIINILENAVQHAKGMTTLSLQVSVHDNRAIFEIKDNGCGINPKYLDTLFTGYYTSDNDVVDGQKKNAGIGLSVCSSIIKAHGGTIIAENLESGGAVFRFELDTEEVNYDTE